MKLKIELVPASSWWNNLRKSLPRREWDKIRKKSYEDSGNRCAVCNWEGTLNCHEIWDYDDEKNIQTLVGFTALCRRCHHIKHIGLAGILAQEGRLIEHFMEVNDCSKDDFIAHREEAFKIWEERSLRTWTVEFGQYEYLRDKLKSKRV